MKEDEDGEFPDHDYKTFKMYMETFRYSKHTDTKELFNLATAHFGIENSIDWDFFDENGDIIELIGN